MTPLRLVPFVAVLLGAQALANLDNAIVNVATPAIGRTLHAGGAALQLTVVAYVLVTAMLLVPSARLGAAIGRRRIFCDGIVLFTVASFGCGIATNATALVLARAAQGAGAALFVAQVLASIAHGVPPETKTRAIAAYTASLFSARSTSRWRRTRRSPSQSSAHRLPSWQAPEAPQPPSRFAADCRA